jgi:ubiquinone/menaquinone biosynthesis C-methylase UbiE
LTADLHGAGYSDQVSIDFSAKAIEIMAARSQGMDLEWRVMDVRKMEFADTSFDVAIDKVRPLML